MGTAIIPCDGRDLSHKVVGIRELFGDAIFDPVFDVQRDLVICQWTEIVEHVADSSSKGELAVMITT